MAFRRVVSACAAVVFSSRLTPNVCWPNVPKTRSSKWLHNFCATPVTSLLRGPGKWVAAYHLSGVNLWCAGVRGLLSGVRRLRPLESVLDRQVRPTAAGSTDQVAHPRRCLRAAVAPRAHPSYSGAEAWLPRRDQGPPTAELPVIQRRPSLRANVHVRIDQEQVPNRGFTANRVAIGLVQSGVTRIARSRLTAGDNSSCSSATLLCHRMLIRCGHVVLAVFLRGRDG